MNLEKYDTLIDLFGEYSGTEIMMTLYWENGNIFKCFSQELAETDSDLPEDSPEYPGYYSIFLTIKEVSIWDNTESVIFPEPGDTWEIDKVTAPMLVKIGEEIVWEKEEDSFI